MRVRTDLSIQDLGARTAAVFAAAAPRVERIRKRWKPHDGSPVFTVDGRYTSRGWTEWTQGFHYGAALYLYEACGERAFLDYGRSAVRSHMAAHLTHSGVHDHGFNNVSTYGNLLRLMRRGLLEEDEWEAEYYRLALRVSGAVQAARWTELPDSLGYIYSFNGPHSLFADTIRSLRVLACAHQLGHVLMGERDRRISLLGRFLKHAETTARFNVYFGAGRDAYDVRGRTAHESIFNLNDGSYRCPSSQQGYSPFSTWTRGLAWILLGYAEQIEFLDGLDEAEVAELGLPYFPHPPAARARFLEVARAAADHYIEGVTASDGVPYWDTGAPGLAALGDWRSRPADPDNDCEPVDSSAAAVAAQGLVRLALALGAAGAERRCEQEERAAGERYLQAGLGVAATLFEPPYLADDPGHEGLLLHSIYHRPNGWDHLAPSRRVPGGEACMWGDYHLLELALLLKRLSAGDTLSYLEAVR